MDSIVIIIGLVVVVLCALPIVLVTNSDGKMEKKMYQRLVKMVQSTHSTLSEYDFSNNFAIGLDTNKGQLFWINQKKYDVFSTVYLLSELKKCSLFVVENTDHETVDAKHKKRIVNVAILLQFRKSNRPDEFLELFDEHDDLGMKNKKEVAERWVALINEHFAHSTLNKDTH